MELKIGSSLQNGKYVVKSVLGKSEIGISYSVSTKQNFYGTVVDVPMVVKEFFLTDYCNRNSETNEIGVISENDVEIVSDFIYKFSVEAKTFASMQHPNILQIVESFEENGTYYYVMPYIQEGSIINYLKNNGACSVEDSVNYVKQIAEALSFIHNSKHCHYDIKPNNIFIDSQGKALLSDFGINRILDSNDVLKKSPIGIDKNYAPIEQLNGGCSEFSPETDIYSLGGILYTLLTGKTVPSAAEILNDSLGDVPSNISEDVWNIVEQSLNPQRKKRPSSAEQFLQMLSQVEVSVQQAPQPTTDTASKELPKNDNPSGNNESVKVDENEVTPQVEETQTNQPNQNDQDFMDFGPMFLDIPEVPSPEFEEPMPEQEQEEENVYETAPAQEDDQTTPIVEEEYQEQEPEQETSIDSEPIQNQENETEEIEPEQTQEPIQQQENPVSYQTQDNSQFNDYDFAPIDLESPAPDYQEPVPEIEEQPTQENEEPQDNGFETQEEDTNQEEESNYSESAKSAYEEQPTVANQKSKKGLYIGFAAVAVVLIGLIIWMVSGKKSSSTSTYADDNTTEEVANNEEGNASDDVQNVTEQELTTNHGMCVYTGEVDANGVPNGQGTAKYDNDNYKGTYTGTFVDGKHVDDSGNATMKFANGDEYKGTFVDDHFDKGTYTWENGYHYEGNFKASSSNPDGDYNTGILYNKKGKKEAKYSNGVKD